MRRQTRAPRIPSRACCSLSASLTGSMSARAARRFLTRTAASSGIVETLGRLPQLCRLGVISLGGDWGRGPVYVRSASNRVEILCTAVKGAKCQLRTHAPQQRNRLFDYFVRAD